MDWHRDLPTWPLHEHSQRLHHPPHQWHVQEMGHGPVALLLHGAGASTHSWRDMIPLALESPIGSSRSTCPARASAARRRRPARP